MKIAEMTQEVGNHNADYQSRGPAHESLAHGIDNDTSQKSRETRPGPQFTVLTSQARENTGADMAFDPGSLPVEERIRYYRTEIERLAAPETFRDEVLSEVYRWLLAQSLGQHASG